MDPEDSVKTKTKNWILGMLNQYKKPLILILVAIVSVFLLSYGYKSYGKDYVTGIINSFVEDQIKIIDERYATDLALRENQIIEINKRLAASEKRYSDIKKRVDDVEIKIRTNKPPVTSSELRDRSNSLGYKPVN
jgi:hypothetical protein